MRIRDLVTIAHQQAKKSGFYDPPPTPIEQLALAHSELSEALEAYRDHGFSAWTRDDGKPEGFASELADAVIRICDMAGAIGLDLEGAITTKAAFNATRSHRHGGKKI